MNAWPKEPVPPVIRILELVSILNVFENYLNGLVTSERRQIGILPKVSKYVISHLSNKSITATALAHPMRML
jgi:hypothetical protein